LIDDYGHARICDFGLVRILSNEKTGMTTTSEHTGTTRYLAYELVAPGQPITTTASDVHAIGCIGLDASLLFATVKYSFLIFSLVYLPDTSLRKVYKVCPDHSTNPRSDSTSEGTSSPTEGLQVYNYLVEYVECMLEYRLSGPPYSSRASGVCHEA
jgi:serine/threonine protein kinase